MAKRPGLISLYNPLTLGALSDHDLPSLEALFASWGHKPSQAKRVLRAFYDAAGELPLEELDIGGALRKRVRQELTTPRSHVLTARRAADGTTKFLVGLAAGGAVEAVLMPGFRAHRAAGCVSSQVGCAMGCDFCASTRGGLQRDLDAGEIVEQFLHLKRAAMSGGRRLTSLVFMGMGEPLANYENVVAAVRRIADAPTGALGWRQVTVSTVGLVPGIDRLAAEDLNIHLALSLHAPDDETRARIIPSNRRYRVADVIAATERFARRSGRIPTIEYCMLAGVNDSDAQAHLMADLVAPHRFHVNLIPYNPIGAGLSGTAYRRPAPQRVDRFLGILRDSGAVAHVRVTRGDDVDAACGQLRQTAAMIGPG
jgi:23S rRNA (adenine2503-C2)-methyltransferase